MRSSSLVLLAAGLVGLAHGQGDKKGEPPAWAKITLGGEIRDLLELRSKINVLALLDREIPRASIASQWHGPPPQRMLELKPKGPDVAHVRSMQVGEAAWVVVLLDETDPDLDKVLPALRPMPKGGLVVRFEGIIAAEKDKDPFVAHANAWGTMQPHQQQAKEALGMGEIELVGRALPGKHELDKGKFTSLAIQNAWSPILVTGKAVEADVQGKVRVIGKLLVRRQGPLVVESSRIQVLEK
jgi:hypothetical protein